MAGNENSDRQLAYRKKRVNRIKKVIVTIVIILLIVPTILSIFLMFRVNYLEKELDALLSSANIEKVASNSAKAESKKNREGDGKKVYLTFEDGPSAQTVKILNTLKTKHVQGTFFVIGHTDNYSKAVYKRIVSDGNTLAMHSYSHIYKSIYASKDKFEMDLDKIQTLLTDVTGVKPTLYRFPGGSSYSEGKLRAKDYISILQERGISYMDWNVVNGDASGEKLTKEEMVERVMNGVCKFQTSVVQMHDTVNGKKTAEFLPDLIDTLQEKGYEILPIDDDTQAIRFTK